MKKLDNYDYLSEQAEMQKALHGHLRDDLIPARGIVKGLLLGAAWWTCLGLAVWAWRHWR